MYKVLTFTIALMLSVSCSAEAQNKKPASEKFQLKSTLDTISYVIGTNWGGSLAMDSVKVNIDALKQGIVDVLEDKIIEFDQLRVDQIMQELVADINNRRQQAQMKQQQELMQWVM